MDAESATALKPRSQAKVVRQDIQINVTDIEKESALRRPCKISSGSTDAVLYADYNYVVRCVCHFLTSQRKVECAEFLIINDVRGAWGKRVIMTSAI